MVPPEVIAAGEALPTLAALKHLLSQVQHLVGFQALRPAEALAALGAAVGPDPRVLPLVTFQVPRLAEALPAVGAQVGLLPRVNPEVHRQLPVVREALAAVGTLVGLLARVHALVLLQAVMVGEAFATVCAQVQHLHLLDARMRLELLRTCAPLAALRAHVSAPRFLSLRDAVGLAARHVLGVVPLHVLDQVALHGEGELAEGAGEELRRAVVLHAGVALLMLPEAARRHEGFAATLAAVTFQVRVRRLLVAFQEAGLDKGGATLTALVPPQNARVAFELGWVCARSIAALAAKPPFRGGRVRLGSFNLSWSSSGVFGDDRPPLWSNELGDSGNSRLGSEPLRPLRGLFLERLGRLSTCGLDLKVWIAAPVILRLHPDLLRVARAEVLLEIPSRRKRERTIPAARMSAGGLLSSSPDLRSLWALLLVMLQVSGQVTVLPETFPTHSASVRP